MSPRTAYRFLVVTLLGFASGLPLALTGQALQAWLSMEGLDVATIGFLSLVGLPYTFKFLWAPLMDRFDLPLLGRRRGWLVLSQLLLAGALWLLAATPPTGALQVFALLAVAVAFLSATQDVAYDAYRTDMLPARERGMGASLNVMGYRLAMIVSGGLALIWTDPAQGGAMSWPEVYRGMALVMVVAAGFSLTALPRLPMPAVAATLPRQELIGFGAVLLAVATGYALTQWGVAPAMRAALAWALGAEPSALAQRWADLATLFVGLAVTLPLAAWAARRARFATLLDGLSGYFSQRGAGLFLLFIVLYKLGDAFAGALLTPFLLQAMHYAPAEVGVVNKLLGLWLTIVGALLGGALMLRLGLWRALMAFGLLQMVSNLGFWWLASQGQGALGTLTLPAFDLVIVHLDRPTALDGGLLMVVTLENLSGGMGTAAFLAFLMSLTQQRFSATQFALLSAFASVGRVWVGPLAGVLAASIGWPTFFVVSTIAAVPALVLLVFMRPAVAALEVPRGAPIDD
ncbi:MAG: MFS transporter [Proteobacteria bacterium]|nr:MFS transporter [Pseudomonadota bacterium]